MSQLDRKTGHVALDTDLSGAQCRRPNHLPGCWCRKGRNRPPDPSIPSGNTIIPSTTGETFQWHSDMVFGLGCGTSPLADFLLPPDTSKGPIGVGLQILSFNEPEFSAKYGKSMMPRYTLVGIARGKDARPACRNARAHAMVVISIGDCT